PPRRLSPTGRIVNAALRQRRRRVARRVKGRTAGAGVGETPGLLLHACEIMSLRPKPSCWLPRGNPAPAGLQETYFLFGGAPRERAASPGLQKEIQMGLQPVRISRDSSVQEVRLLTWNTQNSSRLASRSSWTRR